MLDPYKSDDCIWSNQSFTLLAQSLFKLIRGYLPESSYNERTIRMLDEYHPRALQWCTTENLKHDEIVSFDICYSYPAVLLSNNRPIPIYSIHDVIVPFECRSDLRRSGEF